MTGEPRLAPGTASPPPAWATAPPPRFLAGKPPARISRVWLMMGSDSPGSWRMVARLPLG